MKKIVLFLFIITFSNAYSQANESVAKVKEETKDIPFAIIEVAPVYKGCASLTTRNEKRKCMSTMIAKHIRRNFNTDIANCLEKELVYNPKTGKEEEKCTPVLTGKQRIYIQFIINKTGVIEDINVRAPHPKLAEEGKRIAELIPKMKPGLQRGVPVRVAYTLPITFSVQ